MLACGWLPKSSETELIFVWPQVMIQMTDTQSSGTLQKINSPSQGSTDSQLQIAWHNWDMIQNVKGKGKKKKKKGLHRKMRASSVHSGSGGTRTLKQQHTAVKLKPQAHKTRLQKSNHKHTNRGCWAVKLKPQAHKPRLLGSKTQTTSRQTKAVKVKPHVSNQLS